MRRSWGKSPAQPGDVVRHQVPRGVRRLAVPSVTCDHVAWHHLTRVQQQNRQHAARLHPAQVQNSTTMQGTDRAEQSDLELPTVHVRVR